MNWFEEGKEMAVMYVSELSINEHADQPECPWPIYAPEGIEWMRGWNSIAQNEAILGMRPQNHGNLFIA